MSEYDNFLEHFLRQLSCGAVDYCVLRNFEDLPHSLGGSDLDLLVRKEDCESLVEVISSLATVFGGSVISSYSNQSHYLKLLGCHKGEWWGMAIDLLAGIDFQGAIYIEPDTILENRRDHNGVSVAADEDIDVVALVKELINNDQLRSGYFEDAASSYARYGRESLRGLRFFSDSVLNDLGVVLAAGITTEDELQRLRVKLRRNIWLSYGLASVGIYLNNFWGKLKRLAKPPGVCVVVTGTDGAGKTTIIDAMRPVLEEAIHSKVHYEHMRPNWLPALGVATRIRTRGDGAANTDPHSHSPSGVLGSLVRLIYYWADYLFGYYFKIFPKLVKKSSVCLFDRYYYDFILDPRRMRISLPYRVIRAVLGTVPKPDLILCIGAEAQVIYQRKPETSLKEVTRQVEGLRVLCNSEKKAVWIDSGQSLQATVDSALSAVQEAMSSRY